MYLQGRRSLRHTTPGPPGFPHSLAAKVGFEILFVPGKNSVASISFHPLTLHLIIILADQMDVKDS